jgi:hypothetical protein
MAFTRSPVRSRSGPPNFHSTHRAAVIERFSAERHTFRKKQSLKPLPLLQRRLNPEIDHKVRRRFGMTLMRAGSIVRGELCPERRRS